ncbi:hypothetical protein acdb102_35630 [Acidothermaceae bacterium B102]|nr:hypothetical protein acdb102_35630 [Acidothermaceae bacterium B102]
MQCYRCGTRPVDPARGPSDWKRGVRDDAQVLVCPSCQREPDWRTHLASCPHCGSTALVRALGEVQCRGCRRTPEVLVPPQASADPSGRSYDPVLADEVSRALDRVLRPATAEPGDR